MSLSLADIEKLIEETKDQISLKILSALEAALNDLPTPVFTVEEYVSQVEQTLQCPATKESLAAFLKRCDFQQDAWKAESITSAVEFYRFCDAQLPLSEAVKNFELHMFKDRK